VASVDPVTPLFSRMSPFDWKQIEHCAVASRKVSVSP